MLDTDHDDTVVRVARTTMPWTTTTMSGTVTTAYKLPSAVDVACTRARRPAHLAGDNVAELETTRKKTKKWMWRRRAWQTNGPARIRVPNRAICEAFVVVVVVVVPVRQVMPRSTHCCCCRDEDNGDDDDSDDDEDDHGTVAKRVHR